MSARDLISRVIGLPVFLCFIVFACLVCLAQFAWRGVEWWAGELRVLRYRLTGEL